MWLKILLAFHTNGGGGDLKSKQEKVGLGYSPNPNTADREKEDVPDIAHLLPFNGKMIFQNSSMTPLLLILTFNY